MSPIFNKLHSNYCRTLLVSQAMSSIDKMFMERDPLSAQNQTLRSYRVYISPTK